MLGVRVLVNVVSVIVGTLVALCVLLLVNKWIDVETPGQVAISMATFAFVRDLAAECFLHLFLFVSHARRACLLLTAHLDNCRTQSNQPILWAALHDAVEPLAKATSRHRFHAARCLAELESYSKYTNYTQVMQSDAMVEANNLLQSLDSNKRNPVS